MTIRKYLSINFQFMVKLCIKKLINELFIIIYKSLKN